MNAVENSSIATYVVASISVLLLIYYWPGSYNLRHIPTVGGPSAPLLSYIGAFKYNSHAHHIFQAGYDKHKGGLFKVSTLSGWLVVATGAMVDELHKFSEEHISSSEGAGEVANTKYLLGRSARDRLYHVPVLRNQLTRQLAAIFPDIMDEITAAFRDMLPAPSDDWLKVDASSATRDVISRVSNRVFLGLPMCRNEGFLKFLINFSEETGIKAVFTLGSSPPLFKPLVAKMISRLDEHVDTCLGYIEDTVAQRLKMMDSHGTDSYDKPNDMLQWLMDEEIKIDSSNVRNIARTILILNFAAIHTSSMSFIHALYHLAADPSILGPLREEIETVTKEDGWTKLAVGKMCRLDSFMRESQRVNGFSSITVMRKAMQDLRFSDGTFVPAGSLLVAASASAHMDEENYPSASVFNPWRFSDMREEEGEATKHQFVSTSAEYLAFGHGRHACPGRFFASNELKAMMAYLAVNYDVKFEQEGVRPPNKYFGPAILPNPSARVLFRKRRL